MKPFSPQDIIVYLKLIVSQTLADDVNDNFLMQTGLSNNYNSLKIVPKDIVFEIEALS